MRLALLCTLGFLAACQHAVRPSVPVDEPAPTASVVPIAAPVPSNTAQAPDTTEAPAVTAASIEVPTPTTTVFRGEQVFARISKGLSTRNCSDGSSNAKWRKRYAGNPGAFANHVQEVLPLLDFVSSEVDRAGLPAEFAFIPLVESWYRPEAIGSGGPAGMWQMISSTARNHGVHIQPGYDGRLSPVESTRAALSYLKTLQETFGGWEAVVMAYNAGEGRLKNAFKLSADRTVSVSNRMPRGLSPITYDYVSKLQALACLISEPQSQGLTLPSDAVFVPLAPLLMAPGVSSLEQFASSGGHDALLLRRINPGFKGGRVVSGVPRLVLTPSPDGPATPMEVPGLLDSPSIPGTPASHQVKHGESLWSIANLYRMTIERLRKLNQLGNTTKVLPGQTLRLNP